MLGHIAKTLLSHPVQATGNWLWNGARQVLRVEEDRNLLSLSKTPHEILQCHLKADSSEQGRVQLIRQVMHIVGYVHDLVVNRRKLVARFRQRGREGSAQHFEIKGQR